MEPDPGQAAAHCRRQIEGERATPVDQGLVEERRHDVPRVAQGGSSRPIPPYEPITIFPVQVESGLARVREDRFD